MDDRILYIENPKDSTKSVRINKFSRAVGYKINIQYLFYFHTLTTKYQKEKKRIPFTTASKRIKYSKINLIKEVEDLYTGNYKTLMK